MNNFFDWDSWMFALHFIVVEIMPKALLMTLLFLIGAVVICVLVYWGFRLFGVDIKKNIDNQTLVNYTKERGQWLEAIACDLEDDEEVEMARQLRAWVKTNKVEAK